MVSTINLKRFRSIIAMVICRNKNHEHTEDEWSREKGKLLGSITLWGKHRAMVESWRFTGVNHRVAERTEDERTETTIPEAIGWAFSGWMERNSERLSELCASVVNNRS